MNNGVDIHKNKNLLNIVCEKGYIDMVKIFLENVIDSDVLYDPSVAACKHGHYDIVKILFKKGINKQTLDAIFMEACKNGHYDIAMFAYKKGANINAYRHIVSSAMSGKNIDIIKFLIEKIPDVHSQNYDVVTSCIEHCGIEILELLIEKGFDLKTNKKEFTNTCITYNNFYAFKYFIENGADEYLKCKDSDIFDNPLVCSAGRGRVNFIKYLVERGADIHFDYDRAFKVAADNNCKNVIEYLIESDFEYFFKKKYVKGIVEKCKIEKLYEKFGIEYPDEDWDDY